ncbi:hypothetical protein V6N00_13025 [Tersicoccus sp. MR15.9]|uniref:hypothetical protein n=1 Tax=Tersicoccus mangrovi TaxID=3121635 RepID=UPI002FE51924
MAQMPAPMPAQFAALEAATRQDPQALHRALSRLFDSELVEMRAGLTLLTAQIDARLAPKVPRAA